MLMGFVSDISDVDLAKEIDGFDDILSDLEYANNTDEIAKKYAKAKKELSEKAKEIPVRIDEIEKSRVYIDKDALENKKKGIENQIDSLDKQIAKGKVDISDLETELNKVNLDISRCTATADEALREKRSSLKDSLSDAERELKNKKFEKSTYSDRIINANNDIHNREEKLERMKADYLEVKSHKMSANATKCPACGREFDKDRIDEITKHFTEERTNKLIQIDKIASETAESIDNLNRDIDAWNEKISIIEKEIDTIEQLVEGIKKEIDNIPDVPDYEDSDKYKELISQKDKIEVEMAERLTNTDDISELEIKRKELKEQLSNIDEELAKESMNQDIDNRVENLESEMRTVQQKIADAERMEYQLNNFIKAKMESVSKTINDQFEICNFKLFETQINGGIKECCEMTVNGVPYSSLNSGHKIIGGVDIVKSLQRLLGAKLPIWIDNAETVNEYNMPDIDCQMVLLKVTDDKELSIR
jgi:chromosome segregation ATPase